MSNRQFEYSGVGNLEWMSQAINYNEAIFRWIKRGINKKDILLEFGSGMGEFCNRFKHNHIVAIELDENLHKSVNCQVYKNIDECDIELDIIYTINVLEHIEKDLDILLKFKSKLQKGGVLKIFVPACQELFSDMDRHVGHYRRYDKKKVKEIITMAGFTIEKCEYFDFLGYFLTLIFKFITNKARAGDKQLVFYDRFIFPISRLLDLVTFGNCIGKNLMIECRRQA